ncbi:MAG: SDR family NAD(P)-dependent oxidoreductase [Hymenobacter sp.]
MEPIQLDVADSASIQAAREAVGQKTTVLDVLVNNAGISGGMPQPALGTGVGVIKQVFDTNVFGVIETTQAFIDLLRRSPAPRIVNVTSGLASLTLHNDPSWKYYAVKGAAYHTSKTALNAYTVMLAYELRDTPFKVNAVDPGFTATDFNNHPRRRQGVRCRRPPGESRAVRAGGPNRPVFQRRQRARNRHQPVVGWAPRPLAPAAGRRAPGWTGEKISPRPLRAP